MSFVSATCKGETCRFAGCGKPATTKVGEEIAFDDPNPNRHNLTAYVCSEHFASIVGVRPSCDAKKYTDQSYKLPDIIDICTLAKDHQGRHERWESGVLKTWWAWRAEEVWPVQRSDSAPQVRSCRSCGCQDVGYAELESIDAYVTACAKRLVAERDLAERGRLEHAVRERTLRECLDRLEKGGTRNGLFLTPREMIESLFATDARTLTPQRTDHPLGEKSPEREAIATFLTRRGLLGEANAVRWWKGLEAYNEKGHLR